MARDPERKLLFASSTSIRLAIGFAVVLCVFGTAMVLNLRNLRDLGKAATAARVRQNVRGEVQDVAATCQRLFGIQQGFIEAPVLDEGNIQQVRAVYNGMERKLRTLMMRPTSELERKHLDILDSRARRLHQVFVEQIVPLKRRVLEGSATQAQLEEARAVSEDTLLEIRQHNADLGRILRLKLYYAEEQAERVQQQTMTLSRAILSVAVVLSLLVIYFTHRAILRPIRRIVQGTSRLAAGDLSSRVELPSGGEFGILADSFNTMAQSLQVNQNKLIEAERMATLGRLAAGVAHEINNPIAVILGYAKVMGRRLRPDAPEVEKLKAIEEEAQRCKHIVEGLLNLSRPAGEHEGEVVNAQEVISEVMGFTEVLQLTHQASVRTAVINEPLPLPLSRLRLRQVVLNVVSNALEALQETGGGELSVDGYLHERPCQTQPGPAPPPAQGSRFLVLRFQDTGPGISRENLDRVFEPFFTTKSQGTGLGLAIAHNIVDACGGYIDVDSTEGKGTTVSVGLPLADRDEAREEP